MSIILYLRLLGLVLFSGYFIYSGINHFLNAKNMIGYATFKKIPSPAIAVYTSGVFLILGGLSFLLQLYRPTASLSIYQIPLSIYGLGLLIIFLVPTTFLMHAFWKDTDANTRMSNQVNFFKNLALIGVLLLLL